MMLFTGSRRLIAAAALTGLVVWLTGCTTSSSYRDVVVPPERMNAYLQDKPAELWPVYGKVLREGRRNLVLNHLRAGLGAMYIRAPDVAEDSFDKALGGIETVYANNEIAKKARKLWYEEGMKDFKGEPYERVMAYYYRGLLYLNRGDFENARAYFKRGLFQDRFAEEKLYRCDFALLMFLDGWASQCLGDRSLATESYKELEGLRPDFVLPEWNHNVLIVAETGTSPRKVADGVGHYELKFRRGKAFAEQRARIAIGQETYDAYPMADIAWQAMTRGGRLVDKILKGQASFRETHEKVGTVLTDVSSTAMLSAPMFKKSTSKIQAISGGVALLGIAEMLIASKVRPRADTRYWDNLPDAVHVFTRKLPIKEETVTVSFLDSSGCEITHLRGQVKIDFVDGQHGFGWIRSQSALSTVQQ